MEIHTLLGTGLYDYNTKGIAFLKERRKEYILLQETPIKTERKLYLRHEKATTIFIKWLEGDGGPARNWPEELKPYIYGEMGAYALVTV